MFFKRTTEIEINMFNKGQITMHFIQIHFTSSRVVFSTMTPVQIGHYLTSFFNDEEKATLESDLRFCIDNAWLHPLEDNEFYASLGKQLFKVDPDANELIVTYIAHQIEHLCANLFDPPKIGLNPIKSFIDANPSEGNYFVEVFDSNGNDVTSNYSYL